MVLWHVLILAVVQGLTEFLPVSSSGHLVIVAALLKSPASGAVETPGQLALNVMLHTGTLLAVLVVYFRRIIRLLDTDRRVLALLFVGSLPAAVVGLSIKWWWPELAENAALSGACLLVTGAMLLWSATLPVGDVDYRTMTYKQAWLIGLAQAVAILPGISRSGATIVTGLAIGLRRDAAAAFSFLLAIPVIGGASLLEARGLLRGGETLNVSPLNLALGVAVSFVVGLFALLWLLRWLEKGRLSYFGWWCLPLGLAVLVWLGVRG